MSMWLRGGLPVAAILGIFGICSKWHWTPLIFFYDFTDLGASFRAQMLCEKLLEQKFRSPKIKTDMFTLF